MRSTTTVSIDRISPRLGRELVRHHLQLLEVVLGEFQILRIRPVELERAEAVNDADRVRVGVLTGSLLEDLVHKLTNAADGRVADHPESVAFGEPANLQAIGILARIED